MEQTRLTSADEVAYPSIPILYTHPDRLATVASLFGMKPAPVEHCRVLELGCFDGANLAAMAVGLPHSEFVGVDVASTGIEGGRALAAAVGLENLTLRHLDLMEMPPDYGEFDYIIAHGLYSWVPEPVRERALAICQASLAPQGVAYVSYNTFPGCHAQVMLREMMLFHNRDFHDPKQKMQQALNLLKLLAYSMENQADPYATLLQAEWERFSTRSPEAFYHDELAKVFVPVYFHQFIEHARQHNLQFLAEADFLDMVPRGLTPRAVEVLDKIGDVLLREQYLDFMRGRNFRKTLLCHRDIQVDRNITPDCVRSYYVSTLAEPEAAAPSSAAEVQETFQNKALAGLSTADPLSRATLWYLAEREPERIPFSHLAKEVELRARQQFGLVPAPGQDVAASIAVFIWAAYRVGLLDLHVHVPPYIVNVTDKPRVSPLARWQAQQSDAVSTLHHRYLKLRNSLHRGLIALLDGSRNRTALRADLLGAFKSGNLDLLDGDGQPIREMSLVQKRIDAELEELLRNCSRTALLMG